MTPVYTTEFFFGRTCLVSLAKVSDNPRSTIRIYQSFNSIEINILVFKQPLL